MTTLNEHVCTKLQFAGLLVMLLGIWLIFTPFIHFLTLTIKR